MDWREFHGFTDHLLDRYGGRSDDPDRPKGMDPARRPEPFKTWSGDVETVPLSWRLESWMSGERTSGPLGIEELSRILALGAGAKRYRSPRLQGRYFRTYASAGGLHPNEVYVALPDMADASEGLYHFDPKSRQLIRLGQGDARAILATAAGDEQLGSMEAVIVVSGIPWRTAWKYGPRGYRHLWWDAGMIVANLMALTGAGSLPSKVAVMFDDDQVNGSIGLDGRSELALAIIGIGQEKAGSAEPYSPISLAPAPIGPNPYEFSEVTQVHHRTAAGTGKPSAPAVVSIPPGPPIENIIWKRGSTREFDEEGAISIDRLSEILGFASSPIPGDWGRDTNELLVLAHAVEGLRPGGYRWTGAELEPLRLDEESRDSGYFLSLNQELGSDGAALIFPMADLDKVTEELGPRGYRAAQLEGAVRSGHIYLAAYGLGLGATGLTFFDQEVSKYFGVSSSPMLEVAIGKRRPAAPVREPASEPQNLDLTDPTVEDSFPKGWRGKARGYNCEVVEGTLLLRSSTKRVSWGNVGQLIDAGPHVGKKLTFSAEIATTLVNESWSGLYVTVTGPSGVVMAMDNMEQRRVLGTTDPSRYSIELPVDAGAQAIAFGLLLVGEGEVSARDFRLEMT